MRTRFASFLVGLLAISILTACGGGSSSPTPTPVVSGQPTPTSGIEIARGERPSGSFSGLTQRLSLNGCRVVIPLDWVSVGDGTGTTRSGARFTVNGGRIASDAAWENAVNLVATQATRRGVAELTRGDDWVYAVLTRDRGFTFRARFGDRYCDVSVLGVTAAPADERNVWSAVAGSLSAAPPAEQTPEA